MEFSNSERFFLLRPAAVAAAGGGAGTGVVAPPGTAAVAAAGGRAAVTTAAGGGSASAQYLFYPGCQLSASSPEHVQQAYRYLDARLGSNVGLMLGCCGAPADWAGRDDLMWQSAERIRQAWLESGEPTFILCCSSCADVFARYLPEIQTTSLWAMICQLGLPDKPATTGSGKPNSTGGAGCASGGEPNSNALNTTAGQTLSIHDACSARYDAATQRSVRDIATALGYSIAELKYSGADTKCCGYGGLVFYANREQEQEFAADRAQESPHDLLVYCAMCKDLFVTQGKPSYHLLDLLFADDPSSYALRRMPTLSERQANRSALRSQLLAEFWGEGAATTPRRELGFSLLIPSEVQQAMEERLILVEDLEDVLLCALSGAAGHFHNIENDSFLASLRKGYVTYWVHYLLEDMANLPRQVRVLGAYSHRMDIIKG